MRDFFGCSLLSVLPNYPILPDCMGVRKPPCSHKFRRGTTRLLYFVHSFPETLFSRACSTTSFSCTAGDHFLVLAMEAYESSDIINFTCIELNNVWSIMLGFLVLASVCRYKQTIRLAAPTAGNKTCERTKSETFS